MSRILSVKESVACVGDSTVLERTVNRLAQEAIEEVRREQEAEERRRLLTAMKHQATKEFDRTFGARARALDACPECGGPTERNRIVISADGDTDVESVCLNAECGWRA
jgi:hypothetical protein